MAIPQYDAAGDLLAWKLEHTAQQVDDTIDGLNDKAEQTALEAEQAARQQADQTLQVNIEAEATARTAADNELKSAINDIRNMTGVIVAPGFVATGTTIVTADIIPGGTVIEYSFTVEANKAGYIDILDTNGQRIEYIGKGSGSGIVNDYSGTYTLPSNFGFIKTGGSGNLTFQYIRTLYSNGAIYDTLTDVANKTKEIYPQTNLMYKSFGNLCNYDSYDQNYGFFNNTGFTAINANYLHIVILVNPGDVIRFQYGISVYYALLKEYTKPTANGDPIVYSSETGFTERLQASAQEIVTFTVPSDSHYLIISTKQNGTVAVDSIFDINGRTIKQKLSDTIDSMYDFVMASEQQRITLKAMSEKIDGEYDYLAFGGGVAFRGKQVYAIRAATDHLTKQTQTGKVIIYDTENGETFTRRYLDVSNATLGGELRDINLSVTRNGEYLLLSGFTNDNQQTAHVYGYMFVLNANYEILHAISVGIDGDHLWGNTIETPEGYLLKTSYRIDGNNQVVVLLKSSAKVSEGFSGMTFSVIKTFDNPAVINEPTLAYIGNKLVCFMRTNTIYETSDLTGETGWEGPTTCPVMFNCPNAMPYYKGNVAGIFIGYYLSQSIRVPAMMFYNIDSHTVGHLIVVDDTLTGAGSYPASIKLGDNDYRVMYFDDHGNYETALYYKKFNPYLTGNAGYYL